MARLTVLQMVQDLSTSMGSDPITTVASTTESQQIADILKNQFYLLMTEREWAHLKGLTKLSSINKPATNPTTLILANSISRIEWIRYNVRLDNAQPRNMREIVYLDPEEFVEYTDKRNEIANSNVTLYTDAVTGMLLKLRTDCAPQYWTMFDSRHVVFDAFNSALGPDIKPEDTLVYALQDSTFELVDDFIPDMPNKFFPILLNMARVACHSIIKGENSSLMDRDVRRQLVMLQHQEAMFDDHNKKGTHNNKYRGRNYGRR